MGKYSNSKRSAFAKGYLTGLDHAKTTKDIGHYSVSYAARHGYRKGINHGRYQNKQKANYSNWKKGQ